MQETATRRRREGFVEDEPEKIEAPAQEAAPPAPEVDLWPMVIKLRRPIEGDKLPITELRLKEPTANHLILAGGNPFELEYTDQNPDGTWRIKVHTDYRKLMTVIANLSGVLEPLLRQMDPRDVALCGLRLQGFFLA